VRKACHPLAPWIFAAVMSVRSIRNMAPNKVTVVKGSRICTIASSTLNGL
jgi:hypothetical protein